MKHDDNDNDHHHRGLGHDLGAMMRLANRRAALRLLASATLVPLLGCGGSDSASSDRSGGSGGSGGSGAGGSGSGAGGAGGANAGSCTNIPEETAGPYPGDGSNGVNALATSGVVRSDITTSFGGVSGTASGVPLTIELTLVDVSAGCAPLVGYAIYLWHCDRDGNYSLYTLPSQNYLRGVQETDDAGKVVFSSIFPGCYSGRWPHIHFETYPSLASARASGNRVATSQLALPEAACDEVYATAGYETSVGNLAQISLASDNVFGDGASKQLATVTGDASSGMLASLTVGITP